MRKVGMVLYPGFDMMCLTAFSAFEVANRQSDETLYDLHVLSERGGSLCNSFGMAVSTQAIGNDAFDTLFVGAGMDAPFTSPTLAGYLQEAARTTRRLVSVSLGSFALGDAGLLDGRRATTHWRYTQELQDRYPACQVDPDKIFVADGQIWTSAGMSAASDLAVGLIENDQGGELALAVAKGLVMPHRRSGGQTQHSVLLDLDAKADRIQTCLSYARRNLRLPLDVEALARAACLSPRQFTRVFRSETGTSPAKAVETLRLEAARQMLDQSRLPVEDIARETGFGNRERMRRAFVRAYATPPQSLRVNAGPVAAF